jgi:capsular polysaccharide biosynthesis protein
MEQEISLREIIEILWKGKWIIILITLVAMLVSGIISFFIIEPTYEARVTLSVSSNVSTDLKQISMAKYVEQVKNHAIMRGTIEELKLNEEGITINELRDKIRVEAVKDTTLLRIYVQDNNADRASEIANTISKNFVNFMKKQQQEQEIAAAEYILSEIDTQLEVQKATFERIKQELANTSPTIITNKTLEEDPYLQSIIQEQSNKSNAEVGALQLRNEEVNPVYLSLQQLAADTNIEIQKLESQKQDILDKINNNTIVPQEYVTTASPAIPPEKPIAPRKVLNVAIAGVVGCMFSFLVVLFKHYWGVSGRTRDNQNEIYTAI